MKTNIEEFLTPFFQLEEFVMKKMNVEEFDAFCPESFQRRSDQINKEPIVITERAENKCLCRNRMWPEYVIVLRTSESVIPSRIATRMGMGKPILFSIFNEQTKQALMCFTFLLLNYSFRFGGHFGSLNIWFFQNLVN